MGMRRGLDGSIWFSRTPNLELVKNLVKDRGRWYPPRSSRSIFDFKNLYNGCTATIIGKGPSLNRLKPEKKNEVIFAINDSIQILDNLDPTFSDFVIQMDGRLQETCRPQLAHLILGIGARGWYGDIPDRIIFDPAQLDLDVAMLSAIYCLHLGKLMGCTKAKLMCFDAAVNGSKEYAKGLTPVVRYPDERRTGDRFSKHKVKIEKQAQKINMPIEWVIP